MGPKVRELDQVAGQARSLLVQAELRRPGAASIQVQAHGSQHGPGGSAQALGPGLAPIFQRGRLGSALLAVVKKLAGEGTLDPDSVTCHAEKSPLKGDALQDLCQDALCEAFGLQPPDPEARAAKRAADRTQVRKEAAAARARRQELLALLADGPGGVKQWNARRAEAVELAPFRAAELSGKDLGGAALVDMPEGRFVATRLVKADLHGLDLTAAVLQDADLREVRLGSARLVRADLRRARLDGADLSSARLQGAILEGAALSRTRLDGAEFDQTTVWPEGFALPEKLHWTGPGPNPAALAALATRKAREGPIDLQSFMRRLEQKLDRARLSKALGMLKSERFQLFVEVTPERLAGIVKSQSDPDLVYSCLLSAEGSFACCTQNLNVCGGLRGALCKHLLVLVVGLAQAGEIEADTLDDWVQRSALHKPVLDRDAAAAILLRYKGAEAGEIDWRPTETVPEDFYAY